MATSASLRVVKTMPFRGTTREYSNRYHFDGTTPADATHWNALSDAVVLAEKAIHVSTQTIVRVLGYAPGSDVPVNTKTYTTVGTFGFTSQMFNAGEAATLVRYGTSARTTKNHPLYLFNYYHNAVGTSAAANDQVWATLVTALNTYAAAWITGFSDGTATHHRAGPNGNLATGYLTEPWITHRDFPRG